MWYNNDIVCALKKELRTMGAEEIIAVLRDNKSDIEKYGVDRIGLFGSYSKDQQTVRIALMRRAIAGEGAEETARRTHAASA